MNEIFSNRKQFNMYIHSLYMQGVLSDIQARTIINSARKLANKNEDQIKIYVTGYEHGVMDHYEGNLEADEFYKILDKYQGE